MQAPKEHTSLESHCTQAAPLAPHVCGLAALQTPAASQQPVQVAAHFAPALPVPHETRTSDTITTTSLSMRLR
jgi:hypothetical protein